MHCSHTYKVGIIIIVIIQTIAMFLEDGVVEGGGEIMRVRALSTQEFP